MGVPRAQVEITATTSKLAAGLRDASTKVQSFASSLVRKVGGAGLSGLGKMAGGVGKIATGAIGSAIGNMAPMAVSALMDGARETQNFERSLMRFGLAAGKNASDLQLVKKNIREVSAATGIADEQILAGAQAYVGFTGDAEGAAKAASMFARVAQASGSSTADIAQAMASMRTSLGITVDQGEAAFSGLIVQGKGGAVEISNMASELAELAPLFALFKGGKGIGGLRELGAGFQVVMKNAATAGDAKTKYSALMQSLQAPRTLKALKSMGVAVTDNKGKLLDASTVFENIAKSEKLFQGSNLAKAFERSEAKLAVLALREHIGSFKELRDAAKDAGAVQRDLNTALASDAGRIDLAMNKLKLSITEAFTPERVTMFADGLTKVVGLLSRGADFASNLGEFITGPIDYLYSIGELKDKNRQTKARRETIEKRALADGLNPQEAERAGWSGLGIENQMLQRLQAQASGVDWTKDPTKFGETTRGGVYSKEELAALLREISKDMFTGQGLTNQFDVAKAIGTAMQTAQAHVKPPVVEVGADKIVDGTRKSMANRTRHK